MIFESVNHITDKNSFLEKILIYIRLVEVYAERMGLTIPIIYNSTTEIEEEMFNIGVIRESDEMPLFKSLLKAEYSRFISCVSFYLTNKQGMGTLLDKLNNKKRKELQEA